MRTNKPNFAPSPTIAKLAARQRILKRRSWFQSHLNHAYPAAYNLSLPAVEASTSIKTSTPSHEILTFADHLVKIAEYQGKYRDTLQQLLGVTYSACIVFNDKSESVRAANKATLEEKCAALGIEGKSYYQLIVKLAFGKESKRASGFVHVIKAAQNQKPSVEPKDFIRWLNDNGGIQEVRKKLNSDGTEKMQSVRSPEEIMTERINKAKDSTLNACLTKIPYGQLPAIAKLGNESDGLAILRQQADGSVVIKLVLNDSKMVDSIYAALGRTLK
ncbi:hypothetical protein [Duganella sp. P38]|uniref:hypothetical protein n=1 Tax=Duganella sp. P38 TaxID=3423949 RepID=UPI003D7904A4